MLGVQPKRAGYAPSGTYLEVSAGANFACAIDTSHVVRCWGSSENNQLNSPTGPFKQISAGDRLACGIRMNGTVACWGGSVVNLPEGKYTDISVGGGPGAGPSADYLVCGIEAGKGLAACWEPKFGKARVFGSSTQHFKRVSAGKLSACGMSTASKAVCWRFGREDDFTPANCSIPEWHCLQRSTKFLQIADTRARFLCVLKPDHRLACYGRGLGDFVPPYSQRTWSPRVLLSSISAGDDSVCGIKASSGGTNLLEPSRLQSWPVT